MPRKTWACAADAVGAGGGFNEAAARCRGKPAASVPEASILAACFNEAAARCRGKRPVPRPTPSAWCRFNEAAARCRGKRTRRNPLRFQVFTAAPRALPLSRRASEPAACRLTTGDIVTCSVVKDLPVFEHSPCIPAALECSLRCGGTPQTMTGSRRTAWNFLPRLTTRGSAPSATPTSTSTTWSLA